MGYSFDGPSPPEVDTKFAIKLSDKGPEWQRLIPNLLLNYLIRVQSGQTLIQPLSSVHFLVVHGLLQASANFR